MRTRIFFTAVALSLLSAVSTQAAPIYTTTDLGAGYQLQAGAGGQVYAVAGANGAGYAFDKSPVTSIDVQSYLDDGSPQFLTLQNGTHQVGYNYGYSPVLGSFLYPTGEGFSGGWFIQPGDHPPSPVSDINSQGQVVGTSRYLEGGYYAAFSDVNGRSHNFSADASVVDNLNNYIATIPGITLTSALKIDDLGRIIAGGSNGDDYLLTPVALGAASPVPEPSTALMLGLFGSLVVLRSIYRNRRGWSGRAEERVALV